MSDQSEAEDIRSEFWVQNKELGDALLQIEAQAAQITALQAQLAEARNAALEEAAAWCEGNMMAIDPRSDPATRLIGVYTAITPDFDPRVSHEGKAYAAAIRAMKGGA